MEWNGIGCGNSDKENFIVGILSSAYSRTITIKYLHDCKPI